MMELLYSRRERCGHTGLCAGEKRLHCPIKWAGHQQPSHGPSTFHSGLFDNNFSPPLPSHVMHISGCGVFNHLIKVYMQACKLAGARRITAVLPLLPYARGDHKQPDKRKPIAAKMIAGMLEVSGANQVVTVDIHSPQTEGFFSIPVDCLTARFIFERYVVFWGWYYDRINGSGNYGKYEDDVLYNTDVIY